MKKMITLGLLPFFALAVQAQNAKKAVPLKKTAAPTTAKSPLPISLSSQLDSASYGFGSVMAANLKHNGLTKLNYQIFLKGMQDAFEGSPLLLNEESSQTAINNLFKTANMQKFAPTIAEGKAFLEHNKQQPGVQTTASGLQYLVLSPGTGIKPTAQDTVLVHYKGTLLNGKQFDSSYDRQEPLSLPLSGVIRGWTEGVQLMSTGAKYRFFVPYDLAYGENGAGQDIPPYSTLIFEIELLKVNGK